MSATREIHAATVTNIEDPDKRGRIKVVCSGLLGDESQELPQWIPMVPCWGFFLIPDVGEVVEVEAMTGSEDDEQFGQTSLDNMDLKYRTNRHYGGSETDTPRPVPKDFTAKNYGKRRGFATPRGHVMLFDDTPGDERVSITWTNGVENESNQKFSYIGMDKDGSLMLGNSNGSLVSLDSKNEQVLVMDQHSNTLVMDDKGIRCLDKFGQSIDMSDGKIQVAAPQVVVSCKNAVIDAGQVDIAGDSEKCILGNTFLDIFASHTHPHGMGPTGPALPGSGGDSTPFLPALSQSVNLG